MPTSSRIPPTGDLRVSRGRGLPRGLVVPERELIERFTHSAGPGGQSVNTADSRVELRWDIAASAVLTDAQRARLLARLRPIADGTVSVTAAEHRSQLRNRVAARQRLAQRISAALVPDSVRRPTRPSHAARAARLADKRHRGELKANRGRVGPAD
jgi:ribosome-associated protein